MQIKILKKKIILPAIIFLLFVLSFFISLIDLLGSNNWLRLPFLLIALLSWAPAVSIGTNCYIESSGHEVCDVSIAYGLYFFFSLLYALLFLFILKSATAKKIIKIISVPVILLIPPFIFFSICSSYCGYTSFARCYEYAIGGFLLLGFFLLVYIIELVIFGVTALFLKTFSSKKYNYPLIAVIISLLSFLWLFAISNCIQVSMAIETKNEVYCNLLISNKDSCIFETAKVKKDPTLCEKIKSGEEHGHKANCYADLGVITKDVTLCEKAGVFKSVCLNETTTKIAADKNDPSLCKELSTTPLVRYDDGPVESPQQTCYRETYTKIAVDNNDPSWCKELSTAPLLFYFHNRQSPRESCYRNLYFKRNRDPSFCEEIKNEPGINPECEKVLQSLDGEQ